ncbi:MAG: Uma2 family endonuclease [Hormoscilla sp. SP5CHS1]|nr:Uma2 family endonuclease [Hormoscilla sp. SP5CHS1]
MVQIVSKPLTLVPFLKLPETEPAREYIDGEIIQKQMPPGKHSTIQTELSATINAVLKRQRIGRAFCELRCTFGGRSIVPDISVFVWERIPRDDRGEIANVFSLAPDWNIEIRSPDQSQTQITEKILYSLEFETQMGWAIDSKEQTLSVYRPQQRPEVFDEYAQQLPVPSFARDIQLTVGELFGWLLA